MPNTHVVEIVDCATGQVVESTDVSLWTGLMIDRLIDRLSAHDVFGLPLFHIRERLLVD